MPASPHVLEDLMGAIFWAGEAALLINQHRDNLTMFQAGVRSQATTVHLPHQHTCNQEHSDGLVQERRNSSALAMELRLSYTNPSIHSLGHGKCVFL